VKRRFADADADAILQIDLDGLQVLDGSGSWTASNGSITVDDQILGNITVALDATRSAILPVGEFPFDVQMLDTANKVATVGIGRIVIIPGVTKATL